MLNNFKICHFSTVHQGYDVRIWERECVQLAKAGAEVHLVVPNEKDDIYKNVKIHSLPTLANRVKRVLFSKKAAEVVLSLDPHLIHFHDPELISTMLGIKNKYDTIKIIFDCHEDSISHITMKEYLPEYIKPIISKIVKNQLKKAAIKFDAIITADDEMHQMFTQWGANAITFFNFPTEDACAKSPDWNFNNRPYDIIYPGSTPRYHLETMFAIAKGLKQEGKKIKWLILADLDFPDAKSWINQKLNDLELVDYFEFKPLVTYSQLFEYLQQAKIGIIPLPDVAKFNKNIPSKMFDFFLAGLPVVLSDLPPSRKFIEGLDIAISVKAGDIHAYVSTIKHLVEDESRMINMGKRARDVVLNKYTLETQIKKLIKLYKKILN